MPLFTKKSICKIEILRFYNRDRPYSSTIKLCFVTMSVWTMTTLILSNCESISITQITLTSFCWTRNRSCSNWWSKVKIYSTISCSGTTTGNRASRYTITIYCKLIKTLSIWFRTKSTCVWILRSISTNTNHTSSESCYRHNRSSNFLKKSFSW